MGWSKRRRESRDQRNVLIFLTAAGQIKFNEAVPVVLKDIDFVLNGLSQNEIKTLMDLLNKVKENSFRTRRPTYIENLEAKDV